MAVISIALNWNKTMAQTLVIKASYKNGGETGETIAEVPFVTGRYDLPKVYPFTKNAYVGPDSGYDLGWISVNAEERRLCFGYVDMVNLDEQGKGWWKSESWTGDFIQYEFSLR